MPDRPDTLILLLLCALAAVACGEFGDGVDAYDGARYEEALETFTRLAEADGQDAAPELLYNQALSALRVGELRRGAAALDHSTDRETEELDGLREFLRGNLAYAECELAEMQAGTAEAEPFAFDVATAHARKALEHWQIAATTRDDWPAARRNAERAVLKLAVLAQKKAAAEQSNSKSASQPEVNFKPAPGGDGKQPPKPGEDAEGGGDEEVDSAETAAATETELTAEQVLQLLDTLAEKEREKLALRRERRAARSRAEVEKDW